MPRPWRCMNWCARAGIEHDDLGNNPIARYVGLMFDKWIGGDYEKGLARLKQVMEQGNAG